MFPSAANKAKQAANMKNSPKRNQQNSTMEKNKNKGPTAKSPPPQQSKPVQGSVSAADSPSLGDRPAPSPSPHDPGASHAQPHTHFGGDPLTVSMESCLALEGCYESERGLHDRKEALKALNVLVKQWIQSVCLAQKLDTRLVERMGGRIVTYGSYMLGISHQGADIDALCLAPKIISREEYFNSFFNFLSYQDEVSELRSIEEAFVPVIKMRFNDIEIDMTFVRLDMECVPADDAFLRDVSASGLDPKCLRSLNGFRSTQELLCLVPDLPVFRVALRAVKLWAKNQGLYSNTLGFLGGFSWATLVAKTCLLYPNFTPAETVAKFFETFSTWNWPDYVSLVELDTTTVAQVPLSSAPGPLQQLALTSWNPDKVLHNKMQAMPIITPTFPHMNSTFNVTPNTLHLIQGKMSEAVAIVHEVLMGTASWENLFAMRHILGDAQEFLLLMASAKADASVQWFGLIESKIRHFIMGLEESPENRLTSARIWPRPWRNRGKEDTVNLVWFVGIEHGHDLNLTNIDAMPYTRGFLSQLSLHASKFKTEDMSFKVHNITKAELQADCLVDPFSERLSPQELNTLISCQSHNYDLFPAQQQNGGSSSSSSSSATPCVAQQTVISSSPQSSSRTSSPSSSKSSLHPHQRRQGKVGRPGGKRTNSQGSSSGFGDSQPPQQQQMAQQPLAMLQQSHMAQQHAPVNGMGFLQGATTVSNNNYNMTVYARYPQTGGLNQPHSHHGSNNGLNSSPSAQHYHQQQRKTDYSII